MPLFLLPVPDPDGLVFSNPCDAVERPRAVRSVARGYGADEMRRLLAVVPDTVAGRRDRAILLTLVLTGRRRTEVIGLRAGDLSIAGETSFYAYRAKGGSEVGGNSPHPAFEAILASLADIGKELTSMAPEESLYARFRRYLQAAGLAPTGIHVLRHTAAKLRRDAGVSIEAVSAFLDHSSLQVTSVYLRRLEGELRPDMAGRGRSDRGLTAGSIQEEESPRRLRGKVARAPERPLRGKSGRLTLSLGWRG